MQTIKQLDVSLQVYLHVTVIDPDQVTGGSTINYFFLFITSAKCQEYANSIHFVCFSRENFPLGHYECHMIILP